jgi:hypothetical protein
VPAVVFGAVQDAGKRIVTSPPFIPPVAAVYVKVWVVVLPTVTVVGATAFVPEPSAALLTVTVGEVAIAVADPLPVSPENCVVENVPTPDWDAAGAVAAPPAPVP